MTRSPDPALSDILDAIANVERVVEGRTFHDFEGDWLLRRGVERAIEIISEATRRIPPELRALRPEIPWPDIAAIGNILRHKYHSISTPIIWEVVQKDLPPLRVAILAILDQSVRS
ncbi:MAG: hypothetical protein QOG38_2934 [Hyphomicrobiales bacterium]|jgi:uncharacterized protein with HEPN domain|nr:hypothetical protein [Hyphomicrobiales bacterium]